jgi:hypothetical protein
MAFSLSHGNQADFLICLGRGDYHYLCAQHSQGNESLLAILEATILEGDCC